MQIKLGSRFVGDGCEPYICAEIGQNHNGDIDEAERLVAMAVDCGADAVKFQLRNCYQEYTFEQRCQPHPDPRNAFGETYGEHRARLDLLPSDLRHIQERIRYNRWQIEFFATPCYHGAVAELELLGVPFYKVASKDLHNADLLKAVADTGKPVILSTGMDGLDAIGGALHIVSGGDVILCHCVSKYPTPDIEANLRAIDTLRSEFGLLVGYSDHTIGILAPALAVQAGACYIEKHITLGRAMKGTDHALSVEADGLRRIVRDCKAVAGMMGDGMKRAIKTVQTEKLRGQKPL